LLAAELPRAAPYSAIASTPLNSLRRMKFTTPAIASDP
jgi:hypothetical protein